MVRKIANILSGAMLLFVSRKVLLPAEYTHISFVLPSSWVKHIQQVLEAAQQTYISCLAPGDHGVNVHPTNSNASFIFFSFEKILLK